MIRRVVTQQMLKKNPSEKWNQFVDLLAVEDYEDLTDIQRIAHLCFWYDNEVENGGHLQYFLNRGITLANETLQALAKIEAKPQAKVLKEAIHVLLIEGITNPKTIDDYIEEALEEQFEDMDSLYYDCEPTIPNLLEKYLDDHEKEFIVLDLQD